MNDTSGVQKTRQQVNALLDAWDPIGVYADWGLDDAIEGWPSGEYERLVSPVLTKLRTGVDAASLAAFLTWDATVNMGLERVVGAEEAAQRLYEWWRQQGG